MASRRTPPPKVEHMRAMRDAAAAVADAERRLSIAVCAARQDESSHGSWGYHQRWAGVTWDDVGQAIGVSKQAAQKRFAGWRYDEPTDQLIRESALPLD